MQLNPEQKAAATDLALYAVNTREMYDMAQARMRHIAGASGEVRQAVATDQWLAHASIAKVRYGLEMGGDSATYRQAHYMPVLREAARQIADHYSEEQAEIAGAKP